MTGHENSLASCTSGRCQANGIDIHFLRTGGDKPPLIALHGLLGSGACLSPLACTLQNEFDVVLPDARGHGKSTAPINGYSYSDLANDVIGLIETLGLDAPVLLGHSMGGLTAAVVASQLGSAISRLVLVDPTFISPEWQREIFESNLVTEHEESLKSTRSNLISQARQRTPHRSDEMIQHLVDAKLQTSFHAFEVLRPPNPDYRELIRLVRSPTLLVSPERGVVSFAAAKELQRLNPLVCPEFISDAGHGLPYDDPSRLGEVVLSFLRGQSVVQPTSTHM